MCQNEGTSLQKGMNFRLKGKHSVILMSVRPNAPYKDEVKDDGAVLIYEGHDEPRTRGTADPKTLDQPENRPNGTLTEKKPHRTLRQESRGRASSGYTKRSKRAFGQITATFTLLILGESTTARDGCSSSN